MEPALSIVVVSRKRPDLLQRCLLGLTQLDYDAFEIIVVCDSESTSAIASYSEHPGFTVETFDEANISKARNLGVSLAAGDLVAFIDDDAVPEPSWATRLVDAFDDQGVVAAGGTVLGANGVTIDFAGAWFDEFGIDQDEKGSRAIGVKLEGTNTMFRREALIAINGFDPAFAYFLDETDVLMRLHGTGGKIRFVPEALVHHGAGDMPFRSISTQERVETIGQSVGAFLTAHACRDDGEQAWQGVMRKRFVKAMNIGVIEPGAVEKLLRAFKSGIATGRRGYLPVWEFPEKTPGRFAPSSGQRFSGHVFLSGHRMRRRDLARDAKNRVAAGQRVTLFLYSWTRQPRRVQFTSSGYWRHTGGLYDLARKNVSLRHRFSREFLVREELNRVENVRCP